MAQAQKSYFVLPGLKYAGTRAETKFSFKGVET
jgi:hypothetical protein